MSGETCFNLNFSNPGGTAPFQSLLLTPKQECSSDGMAAGDSDGSKESTPTIVPMSSGGQQNLLPNGKKTKGRVKIKMEYIGNKLRRYTTFSKRKTGIMKKAHELSTLTGTQVMLLVASETGHVYAFATNKLKPMIANEPGRSLIQTCLKAPDDPVNDATSVKTEFTFEPSNGALSNAPPRKRKYQPDISETLSMPTMVSSTSPMEVYADSDDTNDEGNEDEGPSTLLDKNQILKEVMRAASENRQRQKRRENKKSNENPLAHLFNSDQNTSSANLLNLLLTGLSSSPSSSTNSSTDNNNQEKLMDVVAPGTSTRTEGQIVYQMPQGLVYPNSDNGAESNNTGFSANLDSHSNAASPSASTGTDEQNLQQLLNLQFGNNMLQQLLSSFNEAGSKT